MHTLHVDISLERNFQITDRVLELMRIFGLRLERLKQQRLRHQCTIKLTQGQICYIAGASGSGKSVLLNGLYEQIPKDLRIRLEEISCDSSQTPIDCMEGSVLEAAAALSKAGLSDAFTMLGRLCDLSDGQRWRYQLARALATGRKWIFADEFTATLDRISAAVIAYNLRKIATQTGTIFVLASCHEDVLAELSPDVVIVKYLNGKTCIIEKNGSRQIIPSHI